MSISNKRFSPSSERNRGPILDVLREELVGCGALLEVGSGTGQHAAYFAPAFPNMTWQATDLAENLESIRAWLSDPVLPNAREPIGFDVAQAHWPALKVDAIYSANTFHIMGWAQVVQFFARIHELLIPGGLLLIYGPFNYDGRFTSASNAAFDQRLRGDDPQRGIRDFEAVNDLAVRTGLRLQSDHDMPANNRLLVWRHEGVTQRG